MLELEESRSPGVEIQWSQLNKPKFFFYQFSMFMGIRALLYPNIVVKTHVQTSLKSQSVLTTAAHIVKQKGISGLWRGFWTVAIGAIPSQIVYVSALEVAREASRDNFGFGPFSAAFFGGLCASTSSQFIVVPVDVVSQRMMLQKENLSALRISKDLYRKEGFLGFYRGFGSSVATYAPFSAVWWSSSAACKHFLYSFLEGPEEQESVLFMRGKDVLIQSIAGMTGSLCGVLVTNPIDVIKTRIQTQEERVSFSKEAIKLVRQEGILAFTKGVSSRLMSSLPFSVLGLVGYEAVKQWSML